MIPVWEQNENPRLAIARQQNDLQRRYTAGRAAIAKQSELDSIRGCCIEQITFMSRAYPDVFRNHPLDPVALGLRLADLIVGHE